MRFKWLHDYWTGTFMLASITIFSLWLAIHGKLDLYVHPRYIVFTAILCAMAVACLVGDAFMRKKAPKLAQPAKPLHIIITAGCMLLCIAMLITRPSSLTSSAASQRGVNSGALTLNTTSSVTDLSNADTAFGQFSVKEWASLLVQTNDTTLFKDKPARITGFVSPAPDGDANVFYLSRFVITCCAIDARPVGVPIYLPGWQSSHTADEWLDIRGTFMPNPRGTAAPNVLNPKSITVVSEPADPYVY